MSQSITRGVWVVFVRMMMRGVISCLVLLACADAQTGGKRAGSPVVGKLRQAMLTWYCSESHSHGEELPCKTYLFMQKLKKAESPDVRKKLVQERSASMPKDDAGRKKLALQSREGNLKMYESYCAQSPPANPDVCSNEWLKKMAEHMRKSTASAQSA